MPRETVTVRVPATTANLGPGFDCLGLALSLYNDVSLSVAEAGILVRIEGEGAGLLPTDERNLVLQAAERVFDRVGWHPAGLRLLQQNAIPVGSGLGSSAAAVLAGMLAANALLTKLVPERALARSVIMQMATDMEGHSDNVAPAALGGLVLSYVAAGALQVTPLSLPALRVMPALRIMIILPDFSLPTKEARAVLPAHVPLADAIFNIGRVALLVHALAAGDLGLLGAAMQDRLHQPFRLPLIPGAEAAITAAQRAGATAVALSGAGPSLVVFARAGFEQIQAGMQAAFSVAGLSSRTWILDVDRQGVQLS